MNEIDCKETIVRLAGFVNSTPIVEGIAHAALKSYFRAFTSSAKALRLETSAFVSNLQTFLNASQSELCDINAQTVRYSAAASLQICKDRRA
jgi:hypothetical protein